MRKPVILITGANGELGHALISSLAAEKKFDILGMDIAPVDDTLSPYPGEAIQGDILDLNLLERIQATYEIREVYHLAAILSSRAEISPLKAHEVNVSGTLNLLRLAMEAAASRQETVMFFFPSSIAVYGTGGIDEKNRIGKITEDQYRNPETIYGSNKLYCENLGIYFSRYFKRLADDPPKGTIDFRCIRLPGLISATTLPSGGTSDFGPEMLHAAARNQPYSCFVREDTTLPFMTMLDAVRAIRHLMSAPQKALSRQVYNITAFSSNAGEFREKIESYFPGSDIDFIVDEGLQAIVDSWPADLDDTAARRDWGWKPEYDFETAFSRYLIPEVKKRYGLTVP